MFCYHIFFLHIIRSNNKLFVNSISWFLLMQSTPVNEKEKKRLSYYLELSEIENIHKWARQTFCSTFLNMVGEFISMLYYHWLSKQRKICIFYIVWDDVWPSFSDMMLLRYQSDNYRITNIKCYYFYLVVQSGKKDT